MATTTPTPTTATTTTTTTTAAAATPTPTPTTAAPTPAAPTTPPAPQGSKPEKEKGGKGKGKGQGKGDQPAAKAAKPRPPQTPAGAQPGGKAKKGKPGAPQSPTQPAAGGKSGAAKPAPGAAAAAAAVPGEPKLFHKWSYSDVVVNDISLVDYIALRQKIKFAQYLPHTAGRYNIKRFRKAQCPIAERLANALMFHGKNNGKKLLAVRVVKHAFEIIHLMTDKNPLQILVDAIINSCPREDSTRVGTAGVVKRQAVDVSPLRRVNQSLYLLTTGARNAAFKNIKTLSECLADEIMNAAKGSSNSFAIKKKDEIERVAKSNR